MIYTISEGNINNNSINNDIILEARLRNGTSFLIGFDIRNTYLAAMKKDPYFKVYNSHIGSKATKQARISFTRPEYVNHRGGLPQYPLDTKTKKNMIDYFKSGGWEETLEKFNETIRSMDDPNYNFTCEMPNYNSLPCEGGFSNNG